MRPILDNTVIVVPARLLLGSIFLFASVEKAADPLTFAVMIDNYQILPFDFSLFAATFLPWVEMVCGLTLILGVFRSGSAFLIGLMTAVFTIAIVSALARDLDISCGCFTLDPEVSKIGWRKVAENAGIIVLSVFLVYSKNDAMSISNIDRTGRPEEATP